MNIPNIRSLDPGTFGKKRYPTALEDLDDHNDLILAGFSRFLKDNLWLWGFRMFFFFPEVWELILDGRNGWSNNGVFTKNLTSEKNHLGLGMMLFQTVQMTFGQLTR